METTFTYERLRTPIGVKTEHISGGEQYGPRAWRLMAGQVYAENGAESYRVIDHLPSGAPMLADEPCRISVTHAGHMLVVATLPPAPHADLEEFSETTALGVDAERLDRTQVLKVRERFLQPAETELIPAGDLKAHILAWTAKEAIYKAMLTPGLDFRDAITLRSLPSPAGSLGRAEARRPSGEKVEFLLCAYEYDGHAVTLAITPSTITFTGQRAEE